MTTRVDAAAWSWGFLAVLLYEQRRLWTHGQDWPWGAGLLAGVAYRRAVYQQAAPEGRAAFPVPAGRLNDRESGGSR